MAGAEIKERKPSLFNPQLPACGPPVCPAAFLQFDSSLIIFTRHGIETMKADNRPATNVRSRTMTSEASKDQLTKFTTTGCEFCKAKSTASAATQSETKMTILISPLGAVFHIETPCGGPQGYSAYNQMPISIRSLDLTSLPQKMRSPRILK